ncbi:VanZ family protein [Olivibacter sitiensis]|uniref:VanZ family protein n=1 Tax=Olivibacter sitiensis TaxID=376470 RepID=UPI000684378E|nr:VanZ family protein [Olivibacter sitiensis]
MSDKIKRRHRIVLWIWYIGSAIYFSVLFYIVFLAGRRQGDAKSAIDPEIHLDPLSRKWDVWKHSANSDNLYLDVMGNIVMFVPFSLVLYVVFRIRNLYLILLLGFLTSLFIETTQYIFQIGVADIDDLILNTLGTLIGIAIIEALKIVLTGDKLAK